MSQKLLQSKKKSRIAPVKGAVDEPKKVVLVGTYAENQLEDWPGFYPYPISAQDEIDADACKTVNEIWLFKGTQAPRYFAAEFIGVKTRAELKELGYPAKGKGHGDGRYLLFKIEKTYAPASSSAELAASVARVIVRTKDFARSPKIRKQLKAYLESTDRKDPELANLLPRIIVKLPPATLRVCENAVQLDFLGVLISSSFHASSTPNGEGRNVISVFSGAMGLDNGIEKAGLNIRLCVEFQHAMAETIRANKPTTPLIEDDVRNYSGRDLCRAAGLKPGEVFLVCGGPPCQAFSTAGKRLGFDDDRGNVFLKYLDLIAEIRPKYFLLENVRGLLSASYTLPGSQDRKPKKGSALLLALAKIKAMGYSATFTLYDSANYGVPQKRERVIMLGCRDGYRIPLIPPTHSKDGAGGLKKWETFASAVAGLRTCTAARIPPKRLKYFHMLGPGQYWKDLPLEVQREAMGKSYDLPGGKTGFYRRLAWDMPSPTLVTCPTMPATDLMHPTEDRALSVEEYARVQMFPDDWVFKGSIADVYKQIGNAVPVGMGYAAARHILWFDSLSDEQKRSVQLIDRNATYSRYKNTSFEYFERLSHGCE